MGRTLSRDLRDRVVAAVASGASHRMAAERFGIGVTTATRWMRQFRLTGSVAALPKGGDLRSGRIGALGGVIAAAIEARQDITLAELAALLAEAHGATFSLSTIHRHLARQEITLKKSPARRRAGARRRGMPAASVVRSAA